MLVRSSSELPSGLRVLDLCTGTGCIPLLFQHEFRQSAETSHVRLDCLGVDISPRAVQLARKNLQHQHHLSANGGGVSSAGTMDFLLADVLAHESGTTQSIPLLLQALRDRALSSPSYDILICNPPYISQTDFHKTTSRSVRRYEPRLALVPPSASQHTRLRTDDSGDIFYPRLITIADNIRAKIVLFEVADLQQARRVAKMLVKHDGGPAWKGVEIWKDQPTSEGEMEHVCEKDDEIRGVMVRGRGNGRSVFAWRGEGQGWMKG